MSEEHYRNNEQLSLLGYRKNLHKKYLLFGRIGALLGLFILPLFYYKDTVLTQYPSDTFYYRLLPWIVSLVFFSLSFTTLKENNKVIFILNICVIFSYYIMLLLIFYSNFNKGNSSHDSQLINSLIIIVFMIYVFSPGIKRVLIVLMIVPYLLLVSLILLNSNVESIVLGKFFNPTLIISALSVLGIITENHELEAFINREKLLMSQDRLRKEIKNRLKYEVSLEKDVYMDNMTGALNRNAAEKNLIDSINTYKKTGKKFTLVYMDIDGLKYVNDNKGHSFGDELIINFSSTILSSIREDDELYRIGGDEFILILYNLNMQEFKKFLYRLKKRCVELDISFSEGHVTQHVLKNRTPEEIITLADNMMYKDKQSRKNKYFY